MQLHAYSYHLVPCLAWVGGAAKGRKTTHLLNLYGRRKAAFVLASWLRAPFAQCGDETDASRYALTTYPSLDDWIQILSRECCQCRSVAIAQQLVDSLTGAPYIGATLSTPTNRIQHILEGKDAVNISKSFTDLLVAAVKFSGKDCHVRAKRYTGAGWGYVPKHHIRFVNPHVPSRNVV